MLSALLASIRVKSILLKVFADLKPLGERIPEVGLIHPIILSRDYRLNTRRLILTNDTN